MAPVPSPGDEVNASSARYLLKFESFSVLSANSIKKYESSEFECSGYKCVFRLTPPTKGKMVIYPDGDGSGDGKHHISVYLAIAESGSLHAGWEMKARFSFLILDQIHDKYFVMRGMEQSFHSIKTEWGCSNCISHATFNERSNGYPVNDECVFGVDVSVIKNQRLGECVSLLKAINRYKHKWKISGFSKLNDKLYSEEFYVGAYKWKILLYPAGNGVHKDRSISIYLVSVGAKEFDRQEKVKAIFSISVKQQIDGAVHKIHNFSHWFSAAEVDWGWTGFMPLCEFKNPKNGYLIEDCCIVEADVSVIGAVSGVT